MPIALIIDDSRPAAESLAPMLRLLGYDPLIAYGPRAAIEIIQRRVPEVILTDINMPGVDGIELCKFLRRDPRTARVPIIALSSDNQPSVARNVMAAGANVFLPKPIAFETLENFLNSLPAKPKI
jgi:CheY-like chemotaxis protein